MTARILGIVKEPTTSGSIPGKKSLRVQIASPPFVIAIEKIIIKVKSMPKWKRLRLDRGNITFSDAKVSNECSHYMSVVLFPLLSVEGASEAESEDEKDPLVPCTHSLQEVDQAKEHANRIATLSIQKKKISIRT
jgi:hypothetical protein